MRKIIYVVFAFCIFIYIRSIMATLGNFGGPDANNGSISSVTECVNKTCTSVIENVEDVLPNDIEERIIKRTEIHLYNGNKREFLEYIDSIDYYNQLEGEEFVGVALQTVFEDIIIYAINDEMILLHELGHAYDYTIEIETGISPSNTEEWYEIYNSEYITDYGLSSTVEMWAECFKFYYTDPGYLKDMAPRAYVYMRNFIKNN